MRLMRRVRLVLSFGIFFGLGLSPTLASQNSPVGICATNPSAIYDDLSGISSPCATARGSVLLESTYLQNASEIGGTALAAYPMLTLRTGLIRNLEFVFDSPSQIAESGLRGIGIYPMTHLGYGLRYTTAQTDRLAVAVVSEILPPTFRFAPDHVQSRYVLGFSSEYALSSKLTLGFSTLGTSSGDAGFQRILPSAAFKAAYSLTPATELSTDLGTRLAARKCSGQSFGDIAFSQTLRKNLAFKLGVGTTFNPMTNTKPHYLAGGFNYRL